MNITDLPYQADSESIFLQLSELPHCVWLDSGKPGGRPGRFDILSAMPSTTISAGQENLCDLLEDRLHRCANTASLPFSGGWIGHIDYDLRCVDFGLSLQEPPKAAWFGWYDWAIIVDHDKMRSCLVTLPSCASTTIAQVRHALQSRCVQTQPYHCSAFKQDEQPSRYFQSIERIKAYLAAGDCYQVNYTQRFSADFSGDPRAAYLRLRRAVPSPFCAYLALDESAILSISPERFIHLHGRRAQTQPIKGTIIRGKDPLEDLSLQRELAESVKNRAENVMIVDLLRNDFGQLCIPGSVNVPELFAVESYANVHHLVSTVCGELAPGVSHPLFVLTCFPGGSITGAPKKRAMEIIHELELHNRDSYCGSIGYFSCNGQSDFNIAIRTLVQANGQIYAWAGGGIVMDSDAQAEYEECFAKIQRLIHAIETPRHL